MVFIFFVNGDCFSLDNSLQTWRNARVLFSNFFPFIALRFVGVILLPPVGPVNLLRSRFCYHTSVFWPFKTQLTFPRRALHDHINSCLFQKMLYWCVLWCIAIYGILPRFILVVTNSYRGVRCFCRFIHLWVIRWTDLVLHCYSMDLTYPLG